MHHTPHHAVIGKPDGGRCHNLFTVLPQDA